MVDHIMGRTAPKRTTVRIFAKKGREGVWDKPILYKVTGFPRKADMVNPPDLCRSIGKTRQLLDTPLQGFQQFLRSQDLAGYALLLVTGAWVPLSMGPSLPTLSIVQNSVIYTGCMSGLKRNI